MPSPDPAADPTATSPRPKPRPEGESDLTPPGPPVTSPAKRQIVRGLLIGGALGGSFGALNLAVGDVPGIETGVSIDKPAPGEPERPGEANWHAQAARYTGWCVFGGGLIGGLTGAAALARDRLRGGAERPPPGFAE